MYEMTAYCGLECGECPAYLATQKDDMEALAKVAEEWSKQFGMEIPAETIICDGCKSGQRLCSYCAMCQVRDCAVAKEVPTCGHCGDYVCEMLQVNPGFGAGGKENLDKIREGL
jgi:hypothetical protein